MNTELFLRGRPVGSVFELLGNKENDITFSIGWAFARCPGFLNRFVEHVTGSTVPVPVHSVLLQQYGEDGITDIELVSTACRIIVEAKRGFEVPGTDQLLKYSKRLNAHSEREKLIVTLSEASNAFAARRVPPVIGSVRCTHSELNSLKRFATGTGGSHAEKRLLAELRTYLTRVSTVQDINSNVVYVVALSDGTIPQSKITWRQMVEQYHMYLTLIGGAYPRVPVNYLGFRYGGQLRSIRHVERCEIVESIDGLIDGCSYQLTVPHYLYRLGPPIIPSKIVRNGTIKMAGRVNAAIDLLLTCDTISEAGEKHRLRESQR